MTGATKALPRARAILSDRKRTRKLCFPNAICGPFCSVPPIGTMSVVLPERTRSRNSVQVSSSRKTVSKAHAGTAPTIRKKAHSHALNMQHRDGGGDRRGDCAENHDEPRRQRPDRQQQKRENADREV